MNIQKLIKIADKLDKLGFTEEAGFVLWLILANKNISLSYILVCQNKP